MTLQYAHLRSFLFLLGLLLAGLVHANNGDPERASKPEEKDVPEYSEKEVKARFRAMPSIVSKRFEWETRVRIRSYVKHRREFTEDLLGRSAVYFPIFEQYLKAYDLPLQLRVLPIIETKLDPLAESHVGAKGLWQIMSITAEGDGLDGFANP